MNKGDYIIVDAKERKRLLQERAKLVAQISQGEKSYNAMCGKEMRRAWEENGCRITLADWDEYVRIKQREIDKIDRILNGTEPREKSKEELLAESKAYIEDAMQRLAELKMKQQAIDAPCDEIDEVMAELVMYDIELRKK
jgi:hypothetical protein